MPLTPDWAGFFTAELAALAAITGFVVVAISINLARILAYSSLPSRAGESLVGPVSAITATSLVLIPGQPAALLGTELVLIGLFAVAVPAWIQVRTWRARSDASAAQRTVRAVTSSGFNACFLVAGALVFAGSPSGLYWVAAGDIAILVAIVLSAWVLMIEIMR